MLLSYRAKFSRCIIFTFFADWHRTSKIKLHEILKYRIDGNVYIYINILKMNKEVGRDAAAKKRANTSGVGKINNYCEDI